MGTRESDTKKLKRLLKPRENNIVKLKRLLSGPCKKLGLYYSGISGPIVLKSDIKRWRFGFRICRVCMYSFFGWLGDSYVFECTAKTVELTTKLARLFENEETYGNVRVEIQGRL